MTTTPTTGTTTPTSNSTSPTAAAAGTAGASQLAGNYNTFLTLLTTQLQNQDPLDPLDTNQFTQQLVEFSSVEQQVNMNTNLQTLISLQQTAEATSAMQFLGSNVTLTGTTAALAANSPATWSLNSASPATGTVTVTSSTGQTAYTGAVSLNAGTQTYSWNGQGTNGVTWPAGQYTLAVTATNANGQPVTVSSQVQGTVTGVNMSQNPPQLTVGGQSYPISAIQSINNSNATTLSNLNSSISSLNSTLSSLTNLL
ncbi:MAG: flagellar hook capping FlgD N-terminal domain-containing protein [Xanthobacteraceae bacterium]|jgi:flagellar basal-body rod modification protein FlgD